MPLENIAGDGGSQITVAYCKRFYELLSRKSMLALIIFPFNRFLSLRSGEKGESFRF
jgi:hypothetical protein